MSNIRSASSLSLLVSSKSKVARDIFEFEFRRPDGADLPPFTPGAHVNVITPAGLSRSYSLTNDPSDQSCYRIAVKRAPDSQGGSASMADLLQRGHTISCMGPSNNFALEPAPRYLFIAGGIGITPIISMMTHLLRVGHFDFHTLLVARDRETTAYLEKLTSPPFLNHVTVHNSSGSAGRFKLWPMLRDPEDRHIYCCGPENLMDSVRQLTVHWPASAVHFEHFVGADTIGASSETFSVTRHSTRQVFEVPYNMSILDALFKAGIDHPISCGSGTCGTCKMRLVSGEVDHRDVCLSDNERNKYIMPCVSRAIGENIEVDF